jgi:decaprenylphospho-beta-D-erythro-pentofuranosid-2-ulose 2-reductase
MKNVLILGSNSDVAKACIPIFARIGYNLILAAKSFSEEDSDNLKMLEIEYKITIEKHIFSALDFENHAIFYENLKIKPTIVVSLFGILGDNEKAVTDFQEAKDIISVNYLANVSILNIIANDFKSKKNGVIICLTSVAGLRGRASNFIYGSSKAGLINYLSGLRAYLSSYNVRVVSIIPGFINTKMLTINTPKMLTASPIEVANVIVGSIDSKRNVIYVKPIWRIIMFIIRLIPEFIFKKLKF